MADTPSTLAIRDGNNVSINAVILKDSGLNIIPQYSLRYNGAPAGPGNPLYVVGNLQLGNVSTVGDGAILSSGQAQALFSSTPAILGSGTTPVNGWKVYNPHPLVDLWVADNGNTAAQNMCYRVFAGGGQYATEPGELPKGPLTIYSSLQNHPFIARSW